MKRTSGYICSPSSGTLSVANGTTRPMVTSLRMRFSSSPDPAVSILDCAGGLDDRRPFRDLGTQIAGKFLWRARHRLHSKLEEMLLGRGVVEDRGQGLVQRSDDGRRHVRRGHQTL